MIGFAFFAWLFITIVGGIATAGAHRVFDRHMENHHALVHFVVIGLIVLCALMLIERMRKPPAAK